MHVLATGYCWALENHVRRQARRHWIKCHALVALCLHPREGWILFDTGYAPRFLEATTSFPYSLYRALLPVHVTPELSVLGQLAKLGLRPQDIRHIVLSHFHADHVAGLLDFPEARIHCSFEGYRHLRERTRLRGLMKGYLPELIPNDLPERANWIKSFPDEPVPGLGGTHDLFADGTIQIISLPGHARGQVGAIISVGRQKVFLAADGCWQRESYRQKQPPAWITHFFIDNVSEMRRTLEGIATFHAAHPEIAIVPSHCPEAYANLVDENTSPDLTASQQQ